MFTFLVRSKQPFRLKVCGLYSYLYQLVSTNKNNDQLQLRVLRICQILEYLMLHSTQL